jgi:PDZ domain
MDGQYGAPQSWAPPAPAPPADQFQGAIVPSAQQSNPYAQFGQQLAPYQPQPPQQVALHGQPQQPNPYALQPQMPPGDPYAQQQQQQAPPQQQQQQQQALQPYAHSYAQQQMQPYQPQPPPPAVDPFSVFNANPTPVPPALAFEPAGPTPAAPAPAASTDDDFWGSFGPSVQAKAAPPAPNEDTAPKPVVPNKKESDSLPPGGEWYDARIFTPTLGVMFFKPQELTDSLFLNTEQSIVEGLGERPVVAFIVEGSSARSAGVELGHVLLKVNGQDVHNPKEASRLIKEGPRPLPLLFYIPNTDVVTAEGEHMVKYDTKETTAPPSPKDWKPKYVVIGGIISQPWMMNMYRSKVCVCKIYLLTR